MGAGHASTNAHQREGGGTASFHDTRKEEIKRNGEKVGEMEPNCWGKTLKRGDTRAENEEGEDAGERKEFFIIGKKKRKQGGSSREDEGKEFRRIRGGKDKKAENQQ